MSSLADRIRAVLQTPRAAVSASTAGAAGVPRPDQQAASCAGGAGAALEQALGGHWRPAQGGSCFVVETRVDRAAIHGVERVETIADRLAVSAAAAALLARAPAPPPFLFFDLETTGLNGGAGTYAFLIGSGWFDGDRSFLTRQFLLVRFADERPVLGALAGDLARAATLVSFNGRSFDAPLIETRYLYHRLPWPSADVPHLDMVHVARRFWKQAADGPESGCSLAALERLLLSHRRQSDVPGFEIPARYFRFVRTGDPRGLTAVLAHNRLDLLSLAALTARALHLVRAGPEAARTPREALALGRVYMQGGLDARAHDAYEHAVDLATRWPADDVQVDALRALAVAFRRARRFDDAARCWRRMLDVRGCPRQAARDASEALAIHHEHRIRDLAAARTFALQSVGTDPRSNRKAAYRLKRIERKLERTAGWTLKADG